MCVRCLVLGSSLWFFCHVGSCVTWGLKRDFLPSFCSQNHTSLSHCPFPCVFVCSVPGVCPLEFMMGLQCCPGAERMLPTDAWRIVAGMCRMCSRSMELVAVGRAGSVLHLEVSRWEKPMGHVGGQHCLPSTENPTAGLLLEKLYNLFKSTNKRVFL